VTPKLENRGGVIGIGTMWTLMQWESWYNSETWLLA